MYTIISLTRKVLANQPDHDCLPAWLEQLAAIPAMSAAELRMKALALETCILENEGEPWTVEGDMGLAVSLLQDTLRFITTVEETNKSAA